MSIEWTARRLISYPGGGVTPPKHHAFNPRPAGVLVPGSASSAVYAFLLDRHPRLFTNRQVLLGVRHLGKWSDAQLRWALLYLRGLQLVEGIEDPCRNSRYLRYRAVKTKGPR